MRAVFVVLCTIATFVVGYAEIVSYGLSHPNGRAGCVTQPGIVRIEVSRSKYPANWRHIVDARAGRNTASDGKTIVNDGLRWPTVLHKNSTGEDTRRQGAFRLAGVTATKPGKARDEYPPAEGRSTIAADIRYVPARPNSAQGASMGGQLRRYCDGQAYTLVAAL